MSSGRIFKGNLFLHNWLNDVRKHTNNKPFIYSSLPKELRNWELFVSAKHDGKIRKVGKLENGRTSKWVIS